MYEETAMRECGRILGEEVGGYCQDLALALQSFTGLIKRGVGYFHCGFRHFKSLHCCFLPLMIT